MTASEELWISRAIDRRAGVEDWRGLHRIAASDPDVWRRVCATLEAETSLREELGALLPQDLAAPVAAAEAAPSTAAATGLRAARWRDLRVLGAVAALLLVAFVVGRWSVPAAEAVPSSSGLVTPQAAVVATRSPDALMHAYLHEGTSSGRVLEQLPLRTLSTRRMPNGEGFEVVFLRALVERAHVKQLMTLAPDEHGRPQPLQVDLANFLPPTNF